MCNVPEDDYTIPKGAGKMIIGNREYSRKHIERYIGNIHQLGGTFQYEFDSGSSKGVRAIEFRTGGGLSFTVLPDRGLDIAYCTYRGTNLVYITPNGIVTPSFYHPQGSEWLRTFFADGEGEIIADDASPAVGAESNGDGEVAIRTIHLSIPPNLLEKLLCRDLPGSSTLTCSLRLSR